MEVTTIQGSLFEKKDGSREKIYLLQCCHRPAAVQVERVLARVTTYDRVQALQDLVWSMTSNALSPRRSWANALPRDCRWNRQLRSSAARMVDDKFNTVTS